MQRRARTFLLAAGIGLSFAVSAPAYAGSCLRSSPPPAVDAFTGILDPKILGPQQSPRFPDPRQLSAAMILSQNTKDQMAWSQKVMGLGGFDKFMGSLFGGGQSVADADRLCKLAYDPKFATDNVMQPLVHRFREVKIINDLAEFAHGNYDMLIVVDVSFRDKHSAGYGFGIGEKYESGTTINVYFIDPTFALAGKIEVTKKERTSQADFLKEVAAVRADVLQQYQARVARLLGPDPMLAPPGTMAATPADRMKAVEDLLRQGLITPEEAEKKKAAILDAL